MGFLYYGFDNAYTDRTYYGAVVHLPGYQSALHVLFKVEQMARDAMEESGSFTVAMPYREMKKLNEGLIDYGVKMGEGGCSPPRCSTSSTWATPTSSAPNPSAACPTTSVPRG